MPDSLLAVVIGGAISLGTTLCTTFGIEQLRARRDARTLAYTFRGNIGSLLSIVERRGYVKNFAHMIAYMEAGNEGWALRIRVKRDYAETYNRNADRLGLMADPIPEKIATFYTYVNSLMEDIDGMFEEPVPFTRPQQELLAFYKEFYALLVGTISLGNEIRDLIRTEYPTRSSLWRRFIH